MNSKIKIDVFFKNEVIEGNMSKKAKTGLPQPVYSCFMWIVEVSIVSLKPNSNVRTTCNMSVMQQAMFQSVFVETLYTPGSPHVYLRMRIMCILMSSAPRVQHFLVLLFSEYIGIVSFHRMVSLHS